MLYMCWYASAVSLSSLSLCIPLFLCVHVLQCSKILRLPLGEMCVCVFVNASARTLAHVCVCMSIAINCFRCNFYVLTVDRVRKKKAESKCGQRAYYKIISRGIFFQRILISCLDDSVVYGGSCT